MKKKIILICTEHRESGKCNHNELFNIVKLIDPEVIFEEEQDDDIFQSYYSDANSLKSLEVETIIKYLEYKKIKHIPVDVELNQSFQEWDLMFNFFQQNYTYQKMVKIHCILRDKDGFYYLNSEKCKEFSSKKKLLEEQIIINSNYLFGNKLINIHETFIREHDKREDKMLENIYNYCKENIFRKAIFFIGFEHQNSIIEKVNKLQAIEPQIQWLFGIENL